MNDRLINNRIKLRSIMELYELTSEDVAKLLGVSKHTVNMWRSVSSKMMPDNMLDLLNYKIAEIEGGK